MAELLFLRTVVLSDKSQSQAKALGVSTFIIGQGDHQGHFGLFDVRGLPDPSKDHEREAFSERKQQK